MTTSKKHLHRAAAASVLAAVLTFALSTSAWGYWSTSAPAITAQLSAATVPAVQNFECNSMSRGLLGGDKYVNLTWSKVDTTSTYEVWIHDPTNKTRARVAILPAGSESTEITADLLADLVDTLMDLLLGGSPAYVEIITIHSSEWKSHPTSSKAIVRTGLLPGLLGGMKCQ